MTDRALGRSRVGRMLIIVGVAVWVVYGIVWLAGGEPDVGRYVPFHLAGVVPGAVMARWDWVRGFGRSR